MFLITYPLLRHRSSGYGWTEREEETYMSYTSAGDTLGSVAVISCVVCWNIQGRDLPYVLCLNLRYQLIRWGHLIMDFFSLGTYRTWTGGVLSRSSSNHTADVDRCTEVPGPMMAIKSLRQHTMPVEISRSIVQEFKGSNNLIPT